MYFQNESEVKVFKEIDVLEASRRLAIISADNSTDEVSILPTFYS